MPAAQEGEASHDACNEAWLLEGRTNRGEGFTWAGQTGSKQAPVIWRSRVQFAVEDGAGGTALSEVTSSS